MRRVVLKNDRKLAVTWRHVNPGPVLTTAPIYPVNYYVYAYGETQKKDGEEGREIKEGTGRDKRKNVRGRINSRLQMAPTYIIMPVAYGVIY